MKKQRIYIDTSVIGGCFDDEFCLWSQKLIADFKNYIYFPVVSEVTEAEISDAPQQVITEYKKIISFGAEKLSITEEAYELAETYQEREILTPKFFDDGLHIAIATIAEIDIVVSWNFKHIVHFDKIRKFNSVNREFGYKSIEIYSPREVATDENI